MFGFIGMLIGVPVFAVIYHLAQELIMKGLKRTKYVPSAEDAEVSLLTEYLEKEGETELSAKIAEGAAAESAVSENAVDGDAAEKDDAGETD